MNTIHSLWRLFIPVIILTACNAAGSEPATPYRPSNQPYKSPGRLLKRVDNLHELRAAHSATLLPGGKVLIAAGFRKGPDTYSQLYSSTAELYDPVTGKFTYTGSLHTARCGQTATLLAGGKEVLITGGNNDRPHLASAEIYNIATGRWTALPDMLTGREGHRAILLKNGKVLIIGGSADPQRPMELFNPSTRRFEPTGPTPYDLANTTITALADGRILIAGGTRNRQVTRDATLYDPISGNFTPAGPLAMPRYKCGSALMADGKVMIIGGSDNRDWKGKYNSTEIYDPVKNAFTPGPALNFERFKLGHSVVCLPGGDIIVAGGDRHIERYHCADGRFTVIDTLDQPYYFSSATRLATGDILLTGGYGNDAQPTPKSWLFKP